MRIALQMLIGILAGVSVAYAQSSTTYLYDIDSRQPIFSATLQCYPLKGNANITFAVSDELGRISSCNCEIGDSIMWKIRHLSLSPIDTILPCQQAIDTIWMYSQGYGFDEIIVSGKSEGVELIGDSIRFDLSVFRKPHQKDLKDLLNDLPGIRVTERGHVEYKGKPVGQILLRGKSTARNQFDMFNRVIKKEDLSTIQLFPEDPETRQIDQVMHLDLVLKPEQSLLGQVQSRLSNQGEIGANASVIRSGNIRWNHAAEVALSQIADSHRPQLNTLREVYDDSNRFKKATNIKGRRPKSYVPLNSDQSEKDQHTHVFYNALYEDNRSEVNLYSRYSNHSTTRFFQQTHFNVNTQEPIWRERNEEELKVHSSLFSMSWKYKARKNLTLRTSSYIVHDINNIKQEGMIELGSSGSRTSQQNNRYAYTNATLFAHAGWQIDSSWTLQTGLQFGTDDYRNNYDLRADSMIYNIINLNDKEVNLLYQLDRNVRNFDVGTSLQREWISLDQKSAWTIHYNFRSMSDLGDLEESASNGDAFKMDQVYDMHTITSFLGHEMKISKIDFETELGGSFFQSDQLLIEKQHFRWSANTKLRYALKSDQSIFLDYSSDVQWLDESYLWRTARPVNLQSYAIAANPDPAVIRMHNWSVGWKEFSEVKGSFSQAKISYQYIPIHYEWRQKIKDDFIVDTLVSERDFNEFFIDLRTSRKIRGVRYSISFKGSQSYSYGKALFVDQKLKRSNFTLRIKARDILQSKTIFIALRTSISRQIWQFGDQLALPSQWNSESSVQARLYVKRFNAWFASEFSYLWRGNIYNETLVSGSIEKKIGRHFILSLGVENLFNLNANLRRNRFLSSELFRESEQTVFGGRVYFKVKYQL